jgi:hypothetical protein
MIGLAAVDSFAETTTRGIQEIDAGCYNLG